MRANKQRRDEKRAEGGAPGSGGSEAEGGEESGGCRAARAGAEALTPPSVCPPLAATAAARSRSFHFRFLSPVPFLTPRVVLSSVAAAFRACTRGFSSLRLGAAFAAGSGRRTVPLPNRWRERRSDWAPARSRSSSSCQVRLPLSRFSPVSSAPSKLCFEAAVAVLIERFIRWDCFGVVRSLS